MFEIIKDLFYNFIGDCSSCYYKHNCDHIKFGGGHCFDNSYEPHYKKIKKE